MIPYGLLSQISLLVLAGAIVVTYVHPVFLNVTAIQNKIATYESEIQKVSAVNRRLSEMVSTLESVSAEDQRRLVTYMPNFVDTIAVPRDLEAIAIEAGVVVNQIEYEGPGAIDRTAPAADLMKASEQHIFIFDFDGSYEQIKKLLGLLEQNHYQLEVTEMNITKQEGGFLSVSSKVAVYDKTIPLPEVVPAIPLQ